MRLNSANDFQINHNNSLTTKVADHSRLFTGRLLIGRGCALRQRSSRYSNLELLLTKFD